MSGNGRVHPLMDSQRDAVVPYDSVWLSASAGTGKTQVLSARVLRLLLQPGVEPSQILCLTFTKAGAAEMASRINETLARWVRLNDTDLASDLKAIGSEVTPEVRAHARTLFASVLDCPGGGLRIDTIHAFAQWLLGTFPFEAGLAPGTRAMEDRDRVLLLRQVLADLLVHAQSDPLGDPQLLEAVEQLSLRMGPDAVEGFLLRCAEAREVWFGPGAWQAADMRHHVLRLLGMDIEASADDLAAMCGDDRFDTVSLRRCCATLAGWDTATGRKCAEAITSWLGHGAQSRAATLDDLVGALFTKDGNPRSLSHILKRDAAYADHIARVSESVQRIAQHRILLDLADRLVPALRLGRAFAIAWDEAKARDGLIDFADQIREAARLLSQPGLGDWIRYKLDRRFDHILVDEAQDTNAQQWRIILDGLTSEFWSGEGQRGNSLRTLFVVGDYKQAIFRFQGTSPENFAAARGRVHAAMAGAAENAQMLRSDYAARTLQELGLGRSFRTSQPLLDFVNSAIDHIGHESFGLSEPAEPHIGDADRGGYVALWRPVVGAVDEDDEADEAPDWFAKPDRQMADAIARQVRQWLDDGLVLEKGGKRAARPGDVMVLVRKRRELAGLIVARLHAAGVPVAGVDRLRLGQPLAVQDLVAALRFAAQPLDDLNLAALLVSPLIGWSQEQLLEHGYRDEHTRLWMHLRNATDPIPSRTREQLGELLALADFEPPQALLHWILSGPWQGRRKLVARLGQEANDPIDELVSAAHTYATGNTASLVGFLTWFDGSDGELKREAGASPDLVRVMTVHGSKGLQAPIVILADATGDPASGMGPAAELADPLDPSRVVPLPGLRREERIGRIAEHMDEAERAEREEHWRLLYVAMTRAEEALFIGGALSARDKGEVPEDSWYARLQGLFSTADWIDDPIFGARLEWGERPASGITVSKTAQAQAEVALPQWLNQPAPVEAKPPRPLAPSRVGEDLSTDPPYPPGSGRAAALRGVLIHGLLERLPEVDPAARHAAGMRWLARNGAQLPPEAHDKILSSALAVLDDVTFAPLFRPGSLAEVPIAATVGSTVIAGTIDRLLIEPDRILIVDYKTSRRPPSDVAEVPQSILRQMAAYAAALETTYPGRSIEAALLYTAAPRLITVPGDLMEAHKQALASHQ